MAEYVGFEDEGTPNDLGALLAIRKFLAPDTDTTAEAISRNLPVSGEAWNASDIKSALKNNEYVSAAALAAAGLLPLGGLMTMATRGPQKAISKALLSQQGAIAPMGRVLREYPGSAEIRKHLFPAMDTAVEKLRAFDKYARDNRGAPVLPEHLYKETGAMYNPKTRGFDMFDPELSDVIGTAKLQDIPTATHLTHPRNAQDIASLSVPLSSVLRDSPVLAKYPELSGATVRHLTGLEGLSRVAEYNPKLNTIALREGMDPEQAILALDHEITHAINPGSVDQQFINAVQRQMGRDTPYADPALAHDAYMRDIGEREARASEGMTAEYLLGNEHPTLPGIYASSGIESPLEYMAGREPLEEALYLGARNKNRRGVTAKRMGYAEKRNR